MSDQTITHFVVLFTAQKQKKFKTWQDGNKQKNSSIHNDMTENSIFYM